jgi:Protein of unknown function (DUF3089)
MAFQKIKKMTFLSVKKSNAPFILCFVVLLLLQSCASKIPTTAFSKDKIPSAPDYANLVHWAAHPDKNDPADSIPKGTNLKNEQAQAQVDVFFVHPTSLTLERGNLMWNGDVNDKKLNQKTDGGSILYQASIFNEAGRIYAPRYRQAHINSYYTQDKESAKQAFDVAYADVKAAFQYYLAHWNNGRPIIIASHSQGTTHAQRLLKEFFEGQNLKNKLVVAYIVGMPIKKDAFKDIPVCETPEQTGCFCSWRTFKKDFEPAFPTGDNICVVNPLTWTTDKGEAPKSLHQGCVLLGFKPTATNLMGAQIHNGILWADKPEFKGSFLFRTNNYHIGDYNMFYFNIREDVKRRVGLFWKR